MRQQAEGEINSFRAVYPTRLKFPYRLADKARKWPFLVQGMWHDGQFTYLRSNAQESPALYEIKDGKPALVAYDLTEDGLYMSPGTCWAMAGYRSERKRLSGRLKNGSLNHEPMETDSRTGDRRAAGRHPH